MSKRKSSELEIDPESKTDNYQEIYEPLLKKPKYSDNQEQNWISGTAVKNYLLNDPALDWLDLYYYPKAKLQRQNKNFNNNHLFSLGYKFEDKIYNDLIARFGPEECVKLNHKYSSSQLSQVSFNKTICHMLKQTPIILQATLLDNHLKLRGIADIIIRSDYINKLFKEPILKDTEIYQNNKLYYLVIDIKYASMTLCANGKFIRNQDRYRAYKGQLLIYNLMVGMIQKFIPRYCYIMAKNWKIDSTINPSCGNSCYDLLGVIDYRTFDNKYIKMTQNAIDWVRRVRNYGDKWDIYNPHINELCLNASNTIDDKWSSVKREILQNTQDISCVWNLSPEHRNKAREQDIIKYTDPRLTTDILGLSQNNNRTKVIQEILKINQQNGRIQDFHFLI